MGRCIGRALRRGHREAIAIGLVLLGAAGAREARASATIRVPEDQPTLKAAVAAAASGDVILFAPGTYTGGAFIDNKYLILESMYRLTGDTSYVSRTVLSGVGSGVCGGASGCAGNAVLEFGANAHGSQVIGLTLTGGENGVASSSRVSLSVCRVTANGDGVDYVGGSGGVFSGCEFSHNTDDGIDLNGDMNLTVTNNWIHDNGDDGIEYRLYAYNGPVKTVTVTGNRINGNAEDGVQIIDYPIVCDYVIRIERNLFQANYDASGSSAAIGCMANGNTVENLGGTPVAERMVVMHNTFMDEKNGLVGGGNTIAINNIFQGTLGKAVRRVAGGSVVGWSLFWNNALDAEASVLDSSTIHVADPRLDANGRLTPGSAAIDAGTHFYEWQNEIVLNEPFNYPNDLGAFEFHPNLRPVVDLGRDRLVRMPASIRLSGAVSDDGRPVAEGFLTYAWSVLGGPGPVTLDTPTAPSTGATFTVPGTYSIRLAASDTELTGADTVRVSVLRLLDIFDFPVVAGADDAEELSNGLPSPNVSDLELAYGSQLVGLRFPGLAVPAGATIEHAWVQFVADGIQSEPTSLTIQGEASDNAVPFAPQAYAISARPRTSASTAWSPPPWTVVGQADAGERSADLAPVIQEIVGRPGWRSGNAIALIIAGSGHRTAKAFDGDPAGAAVLHIEATPAVTGIGADPPSLALRTAGGGPGRGSVTVEFTLPNAHRATLELNDLAGRRIASREVGSFGAGDHRLTLARGLPAGVFFARLRQDAATRVLKTVVLP